MRFTHRERQLFLGLLFFAIVVGLFVLVIKPALARIEVLTRVVPEITRDLGDIKTKSRQYLDLQAELDDFKRKASSQKKDFKLLTFLESTINREGLTEKITTMKQKVLPLDSNYIEIIVEVGLENITLDQMVKLLLKLNSSNHFLKIKSLFTKKSTMTSSHLDTMVQISTFKSN